VNFTYIKECLNGKNHTKQYLTFNFRIGLYAFPEFVAHIPDFGIKLKLLLTTGLIPAELLAFVLNATLPQK